MYVVKEAIENIKIAGFFSGFFWCGIKWFFSSEKVGIYILKICFFPFFIAQAGKSETQISPR